MDPIREHIERMSRRYFFESRSCKTGDYFKGSSRKAFHHCEDDFKRGWRNSPQFRRHRRELVTVF